LFLYLPGNLYDNLPLWPLFLIILSGSLLYTWAFAGSGGSALIAALMHAASNGLTPLSRGIDPVTVWQVQGIVIAVIAAAVVILSSRMRRPIGRLATDSPAGETQMELTTETAPA
jgi:membrane protease YdiL (CAAX protease family)